MIGIPVYIVPDTPRWQLSADCPVTDAYRTETNAWAREFFGTTNLLKDGQVVERTRPRAFYMNPRTAAALKKI